MLQLIDKDQWNPRELFVLMPHKMCNEVPQWNETRNKGYGLAETVFETRQQIDFLFS